MLNICSLIGDQHEVEEISPEKNLYQKLQEMKPNILYMIGEDREHREILEIFRGKNVMTVSDSHEDCGIYINDEPEQVFPLLVKAIESGQDLSAVKGITYRHKTEKAERWDISKSKPTDKNTSFLTYSTRGCKGNCSFCNIKLTQGSLRVREISEVIEEIKSFTAIEGFNNHFRFADPSFDSNSPKRMKEIARAIIKELPGHTYGANFRPDFHTIADVELMTLLYESGLISAFVGAETGNEEDLQLYNKGTTVFDAEKTIELFRRYDCAVECGFIMFNPFSTTERLRKNVAFLSRNRLATFDHLNQILTTTPDLPIMQKIIAEGLLYAHSYDVRDKMVKALMLILRDIKNELNKKAIEIYSCLSTKEAKRQKRIATCNNDRQAFGIAEKYEMLMESVIMLESDSMVEWFNNILDMTDKGRPLTEIITRSNNYLNDEKLKVTIKYFTTLEGQMRAELQQLWDSREDDHFN
jgi:hypothetical protein